MKLKWLGLWLVANTLSLGISFALMGRLTIGRPYFATHFPRWADSLIAGAVLGLVQWLALFLFVKQQREALTDQTVIQCEDKLVQWIAGSTIGLVLISQFGILLNIFNALTNLRSPLPTDLEAIRIAVLCGVIAGFVGGLILGIIQGFGLISWWYWGLINAIAWAIAWGIGSGIVEFMQRWNYWTYWVLPRFSERNENVILLGTMGFVAGFVSSVITAFGLLALKSLRRVIEFYRL